MGGRGWGTLGLKKSPAWVTSQTDRRGDADADGVGAGGGEKDVAQWAHTAAWGPGRNDCGESR